MLASVRRQALTGVPANDHDNRWIDLRPSRNLQPTSAQDQPDCVQQIAIGL
jgi:hypothetical protein